MPGTGTAYLILENPSDVHNSRDKPGRNRSLAGVFARVSTGLVKGDGCAQGAVLRHVPGGRRGLDRCAPCRDVSPREAPDPLFSTQDFRRRRWFVVQRERQLPDSLVVTIERDQLPGDVVLKRPWMLKLEGSPLEEECVAVLIVG